MFLERDAFAHEARNLPNGLVVPRGAIPRASAEVLKAVCALFASPKKARGLPVDGREDLLGGVK